jgi:hypothetical protein
METLEVLRREIKASAFDQYGTIVDIQRGLTGSGLIERCKNTGRVCSTATPAHGAVKLQEQRRLRIGFFVDDSAQYTRRLVIGTSGNRHARASKAYIWPGPLPKAQAAARKPRQQCLPRFDQSVPSVPPFPLPTPILFKKRSKEKEKEERGRKEGRK